MYNNYIAVYVHVSTQSMKRWISGGVPPILYIYICHIYISYVDIHIGLMDYLNCETSENGQSSRINEVLSRIFREAHVCLFVGSHDTTCCHIFLPRKKRSRTQKETVTGSHVGTLAAFVLDNLYMDSIRSTIKQIFYKPLHLDG